MLPIKTLEQKRKKKPEKKKKKNKWRDVSGVLI